jgi:hypothetical protein
VGEGLLRAVPDSASGASPHETTAAGAGFDVVVHEEYENTVAMTVERFADYLLTQSNAVAGFECAEVPAGLRERIHRETAPYFRVGDAEASSRTLHFAGDILCLWLAWLARGLLLPRRSETLPSPSSGWYGRPRSPERAGAR